MPNVSDVAYRRRYQLYENKPAFDESAEESRMSWRDACKASARRSTGTSAATRRVMPRKLVSGE